MTGPFAVPGEDCGAAPVFCPGEPMPFMALLRCLVWGKPMPFMALLQGAFWSFSCRKETIWDAVLGLTIQRVFKEYTFCA